MGAGVGISGRWTAHPRRRLKPRLRAFRHQTRLRGFPSPIGAALVVKNGTFSGTSGVVCCAERAVCAFFVVEGGAVGLGRDAQEAAEVQAQGGG